MQLPWVKWMLPDSVFCLKSLLNARDEEIMTLTVLPHKKLKSFGLE